MNFLNEYKNFFLLMKTTIFQISILNFIKINKSNLLHFKYNIHCQ
jgi:hypothetical protein